MNQLTLTQHELKAKIEENEENKHLDMNLKHIYNQTFQQSWGMINSVSILNDIISIC